MDSCGGLFFWLKAWCAAVLGLLFVIYINDFDDNLSKFADRTKLGGIVDRE